MNIIIQKLKKEEKDIFLVAEKYYSILSAINSLHLTERELQLIAFTAVKGNISYKQFREEFCKTYSTSSPTINNMISKLKRMNILVKDGLRGINSTGVKVNPILILDFNKPIQLNIFLSYGQAKES